MLNAAEAKKMTDSAIDKQIMTDLEDAIKAAISRGEYKIKTHRTKVTPAAEDRLVSLGYKVYTSSQLNSVCICWGNTEEGYY